MTTTTVGSTLAHDPSASDIYDPDDVYPQNSPLMKPHRPKLEPSPSPPAIPLPKVSLSSSSGRKSSNGRQKVRPSLGDAVLIHYLDGGKRPEIVAEAWSRPLAQYDDDDDDDDDDHSKGDTEETIDGSGDEEDTRSHDMSPVPVQNHATRAPEPSGTGAVDLRFLATNALAAAANAASHTADADSSQPPDDDAGATQRAVAGQGLMMEIVRDDSVMKDVNRPVLAAPISPYPSQGPQEMFSPRHYPPGQVLMHPNNVRSPPGLSPPTGHGELAPIQEVSPKSDSTNHESLPSIRSTLLDQLTGPTKDLTIRHGPQSPYSPPGGPPRMSGIPGSHASPPVSPNEVYRHAQGMPSPAHTIPALSPFPYYSSGSSVSHHRTGPDYSSGSNTDTPGGSADGLTPATSITERMSIDNMTNPVVGAFVCNVPGCNAPPFQTQYLLNSHANVHSSARPHYCSVKGCPRSEGGKGFKRKNEMIRHGLVHDSPGYVCPFCPDREHKYPRPDNLQRHVRVHHVDKDKDDPLLRDVLSQRPDGPNRGRRRRGGP
ncbi:hypothetical protein GGR54DRAFT_629052 [Hypoxylon sp. NC1633]|nr:hypothetical protein GGR54DRAFT_629052 [Hypoxylon sp. NC1633]